MSLKITYNEVHYYTQIYVTLKPLKTLQACKPWMHPHRTQTVMIWTLFGLVYTAPNSHKHLKYLVFATNRCVICPSCKQWRKQGRQATAAWYKWWQAWYKWWQRQGRQSAAWYKWWQRQGRQSTAVWYKWWQAWYKWWQRQGRQSAAWYKWWQRQGRQSAAWYKWWQRQGRQSTAVWYKW